MAEYVRRLVAGMPPLTEQQKARIALIIQESRPQAARRRADTSAHIERKAA
jgi:hypothetical protein